MLRARTQQPAQRTIATADLTAREREVLSLLARGRSNAEIAAELFLVAGIVKGYVSAIFTRLGVRNRVERRSGPTKQESSDRDSGGVERGDGAHRDDLSSAHRHGYGARSTPWGRRAQLAGRRARRVGRMSRGPWKGTSVAAR